MKRYQFRLQRVLDVRQKQLALEESRVKRQAALVAGIERERAEVQAAVQSAETEVRTGSNMGGSDLAMFSAFRISMQVREKQLARRHQECSKQLARQRVHLLETRRRCLLLERLNQRKLAEWKAALEKELEELASESFLSAWNRDAR